jgi:acetyl-CoA carboxylase carboxyltransferase component
MSSSSKASERITALLDDNSFVEIGALVTARATSFNLTPEETPSDGVVTGYGTIDGNLVFVYSQDPSVLGGSIGEMHAKKIAGLYDLAIKTGAPVIGLLDSTGLRLQEGPDALNAFASIYALEAKASGVIPQITAVFGSCGGGLALVAGMSDFTFMAEDGKLFVSSPNAVEGNKNTDTSAAVYKAESGNVDAVSDANDVLRRIRDLVSVLPANNEDENTTDCTDDLNRACDAVAANAADVRAAAKDIADGYAFIETKADYAKDMVTGFVRLNGSTVGVVANAETKLSTEGCRKAARFVNFCDAFEIPVVSLTNVDGFARTESEEKTIGAAAAQLAFAFADASVPKVNVVINAIGSAYGVMNAKATGADITIAFPDTKIGIMDADMAAQILAEGKSAEEIAAAAKQYDELQNGSASAAARGYIDQIVAPADLRKYLIGALEMLYTKREEVVSKKHGTV